MEDFDYDLPASSIAQVPAEPRTSARLLDATRCSGPARDRVVDELPELLGPGDLVVLNETRVDRSRVLLRKETGGEVEVLLLEPIGGTRDRWAALVRPGRRVRAGAVLWAGEEPALEALAPIDDEGSREVRVINWGAVAGRSSVALPPYVREPLDDPDRYQTVFARLPGSVAAPTAGLHFSTELLDRCCDAGARLARVDLSVGMATFRPVTAAKPEQHRMHSERYSVPASTMAACAAARRVVAVGTTTLRALESAAATGRLGGRTSLFIRGDFNFRVVDVLLTNFHMPRSSLLLLLDAFCGPRWRELYAEALGAGYRFLSFGDAMIVSRRPVASLGAGD